MPAPKRPRARDMFAQAAERRAAGQAPLAARMRPQTLDEFVGQEHIVGEGRLLRKAIEAGQPPSIFLSGPPRPPPPRPGGGGGGGSRGGGGAASCARRSRPANPLRWSSGGRPGPARPPS